MMKTKKREQQIFESAQRNVEPARKAKIVAENFFADASQHFGKCSDGAEPGAERFLCEETHGQKRHEEKHGRGMNGGHAAGEEEDLEVHQAGDGQPALGAGRTRDLKAHAAALEEANPEVELNT